MLGGAIASIFRVFSGAYKNVYFALGPLVDVIRCKNGEPSDKKTSNVHILNKSKGRHGLRVAGFSR